jgi:hypothetical protein
MDYWVVIYTPPLNPPRTLDGLYATPFQAQTKADEYAAMHPTYVYGVRPATWQEREANMFTSGVYTSPVWVEERFWQNYGHHFIHHYVHVSHADAETVAFTEDARKGEADRQTLIKPGKYLQKFMGAGPSGEIEHGPMKGYPPVITKQQVAYYAAWHKAGTRPESEDTLHFATTADEMVRVYREGPYSCMRGCDKNWSDEDHPVQIYAAGDLQFAYLNNASMEVIGRALCWPDKQVFGRVYPTPNSPGETLLYDELHQRLKSLGWTSINERQNVFEGARLLRARNSDGEWMMPYLDHEYGVEDHYPSGGGSFWKMTHDSHHQDNTDGTYCGGDDDEDFDWHCDCCEDGFSDNHSSYSVYSGWRVTAPGRGYATGERSWCEGCQENNAYYCDGAEEYFTDNTPEVEVGHERFCKEWFIGHGGYMSSWSDEWFLAEDDPKVELANGVVIAESEVDEAAFRCLFDGQLWSKDWGSETVPGYAAPYDGMPVHPVEMEFTLPDPLVHPDDVWAWARGHVLPPSPPSHDPIVEAVYGHLTQAA